jgi:hypothetical protein
MNPYKLFCGYRFVFGFSSEGEHKVRPYIGFGHWLDFGIFSRQHFPLTCTYARCDPNHASKIVSIRTMEWYDHCLRCVIVPLCFKKKLNELDQDQKTDIIKRG